MTSRVKAAMLGMAGLFAAGALVGALYAPDKGERTRRKIMRKGRWMRYSAANAMEEGRDNLQELKDRLKDDLQKINDELERLSHC